MKVLNIDILQKKHSINMKRALDESSKHASDGHPHVIIDIANNSVDLVGRNDNYHPQVKMGQQTERNYQTHQSCSVISPKSRLGALDQKSLDQQYLDQIKSHIENAAALTSKSVKSLHSKKPTGTKSSFAKKTTGKLSRNNNILMSSESATRH